MIYEYIITAFKVIVGVITNNRIALAGMVALGIMLIWIFFSLLFSFQGKFTNKVRKLNTYVSRNGISGDAKQGLDELVVKMPSEFQKGFKKFERNPHSLPSDNIKRFDSLDIELSGGVFNQNKSVLKTYTNFVFITLLIFSMAILSTEEALTGYMLAESAIIPLLFLLISKLIYYVYTAIRQYQYKTAVEEFNYLLENLDKVAVDTYGYIPTNFSSNQNKDVLKGTNFEPDVQILPIIEPAIVEEEFIQKPKAVEEHKEENEEPVVEHELPIFVNEEQEVFVEEKSNFQEEEKESQFKEPEEEVQINESQNEEVNANSNSQSIEEEHETPYIEDIETEEIEVVEPQQEILEENKSEFPEEEGVEEDEIIEVVPVNKEEEEIQENSQEEKNVYKDNFKPNFASLLEEEVVQKRGRGRPRKEVSETGELIIKNDKEFEDALLRAEKLMRKNEEPLSASQTKRIEKQIKELVDAMTKYKEGK